MMHKTWNVRDQTKEAIEELLERKYKEIDGNYKMLRKVSRIEDAKRLVEILTPPLTGAFRKMLDNGPSRGDKV